MLEKFGMSKYKPRLILLFIELSLSSNDRPEIEEKKKEKKNISYYKILGSPIWLQMATQPNLLFAVNLLFCFMSNPRKAHWKAMKHMLIYVKETIDYEITYYHRLSLQPIVLWFKAQGFKRWTNSCIEWHKRTWLLWFKTQRVKSRNNSCIGVTQENSIEFLIQSSLPYILLPMVRANYCVPYPKRPWV